MVVLCNACCAVCFHTEADFLNANKKFEIRLKVFSFPAY